MTWEHRFGNATVRFSFSHDFLLEVGRTAKFPFAVWFHQRSVCVYGGGTCCKLSEQCVHLYLNSQDSLIYCLFKTCAARRRGMTKSASLVCWNFHAQWFFFKSLLKVRLVWSINIFSAIKRMSQSSDSDLHSEVLIIEETKNTQRIWQIAALCVQFDFSAVFNECKIIHLK